jgi:transposase-like protein
MSKAMRALIKRVRFPVDIMLTCVRCYLAYALSLRNLEEMMEEEVYSLIIPRFTAGSSSSHLY